MLTQHDDGDIYHGDDLIGQRVDGQDRITIFRLHHVSQTGKLRYAFSLRNFKPDGNDILVYDLATLVPGVPKAPDVIGTIVISGQLLAYDSLAAYNDWSGLINEVSLKTPLAQRAD